MVELVLDAIAPSRVLMLITARPTFSHGFGGHPIVTRLALNRLGRTQTAAIIERIAGRRMLPERLVEEIATRTDRVPLFVEEMTKAVLETSGEEETVGTRLAVPTSLHDSLMARLDRLKSVKEVAQTAAVIGRAFDHLRIVALASLPETDVAAALDRLVGAELVFRRGSGPATTYLFKHALVRDAAYESLLKTRRQALHGRLFDILELRGDAPPEILAQHAEAAGVFAKAIDCWERAGQEAIGRPAYKEAIANLEAAIRLCRQITNDPEWLRRECQLQIRLGQALLEHLGYQAPGTMVAFERARELAEQIGEPSLLVPSMYGLWANRYVSGIPAPELAERFADLTASDGDSGSRCVALRMLGLERFHEGQVPDIAAPHRGRAFLLRSDRPPGSGHALRARPANGSHELPGLDPLVSRLPGSGARDDGAVVELGARNRAPQHDRHRAQPRHCDDGHMVPRCISGGGRRR
jgi:hypothetical protein